MVFLVCFNQKYKGHNHALCVAKNQEELKKRVAFNKNHANGHVAKSKIDFEVTMVWPNEGAYFAKILKADKHLHAFCPKCRKFPKKAMSHLVHTNNMKQAHVLDAERQNSLIKLADSKTPFVSADLKPESVTFLKKALTFLKNCFLRSRL